MSQPVSYVEFNSPDLEATSTFLTEVFGWQFQPFAVEPFTIPDVGRGCYILDSTGLLIGLQAYDA